MREIRKGKRFTRSALANEWQVEIEKIVAPEPRSARASLLTRRTDKKKADLQTQIWLAIGQVFQMQATGDSESTDHEFSLETNLAFASSAIVLLLITLSARVSTFGWNSLSHGLQVDHELENCWLRDQYLGRLAPFDQSLLLRSMNSDSSEAVS